MSWFWTCALRSIVSTARRVRGRVELARAQHVRPAHDRVERRAELVRERREELVLQAVRLLRLEVEARVLDGDAGAVGDLLAERDVRRVPGAVRPAPHERALALAEDGDRHDEEVAVAEEVEEPRVLGVDAGRPQPFGRAPTMVRPVRIASIPGFGASGRRRWLRRRAVSSPRRGPSGRPPPCRKPPSGSMTSSTHQSAIVGSVALAGAASVFS